MVYRFFSRYFGINVPINTSFAQRKFKLKASELMDRTKPGVFNQALMEFGALQCTPHPFCKNCPYRESCFAFNQKKITCLPVKKKTKKMLNRYFHYLVIQDKKGQIIFERRTKKDIWKNLFQFPLIETNSAISNKKDFIIEKKYKEKINLKELKLWNNKPIIHKLSHQKLFVFFWYTPSLNILKNGHTIKDLNKLAVPVIIQKFLEIFFKIEA